MKTSPAGWLPLLLMLLSLTAYSQVRISGDGEWRFSGQRNGTGTDARVVKFEETFADTAGLNWLVLNADGSSNAFGPTVGEFADILNFPDGSQVVSPLPGTFFWSSNFSNANGRLIDEWLISPQLPAVEAGDTLHFYGGAPDNNRKDSIQVWIATRDPQGGTAAFEYNLGRFKMNGPTGNWDEFKIALDHPDFLGVPIWLGLRYWHTDGGPFGSNSNNVWIDHVQITNTPAAGSFTQSLSDGWNLIGLPLAVADSAVGSLYPGHTPNTLFSYNGVYQSETHLARCQGYWLNFPASASATITGQAVEECVIDLVEGWNLITGPSCDVPVTAIEDLDGIIVPGTVFGFSGSYFAADTIKNGGGYWIRASASGRISLRCAGNN